MKYNLIALSLIIVLLSITLVNAENMPGQNHPQTYTAQEVSCVPTEVSHKLSPDLILETPKKISWIEGIVNWFNQFFKKGAGK